LVNSTLHFQFSISIGTFSNISTSAIQTVGGNQIQNFKMLFMSCKLVRSCVLLLLVIFLLPQSSLFGQNNNDDTLLVNREKVKWEALKSRTFAAHNEWFSKEMASIGYLPDASVYRTGFGDNFVFPKIDDLPPSTFILSGFKIVNASNEVKIVSYKADGPLFLYVTSIWAKRDNEWKTVFYQATKYK